MCCSCQNCEIRFIELFNKLYAQFGPRNWWPAKTKFEVMVGAVLTQNTSWSNVEKAIANFGDNLCPFFIGNASLEELIDIIRPCGYYNQKAKTLKLLCQWFSSYDYKFENIKNMSVERLRDELLKIKGIGKETADSIILYAVEKPIFVVDNYTRRILQRLGMDLPAKYDEIRSLIENSFRSFISKQKNNSLCEIFIINKYLSTAPLDELECRIYNEFHALIVEHAKKYCTKKPDCYNCFLNIDCHYKDICSD